MKSTIKKRIFSTLTAICCSCSLFTSVPYPTNRNNILCNAIVAEAATLSGTKVASAGTTLTLNKKYISPNGKYALIFESNGNLVVYHYNKTTGQAYNAIWTSRTAGNNSATCNFQSNGNLRITTRATVWESRTSGKGGAYLYIMDDGELRIVSSDTSRIIWGTYHNGDLLSAHFKKYDFICPCGCNGVKYDQELIDKLEQLYTKLDCSNIIVKSGYRCPTYSPTVPGGFSTDGHTRGIAATIVCYNSSGAVIPCEEVAWAAEQLGFNGIGLFHNNEIHLDVRNGVNYTNAHWFGDDRTGNNNISTFKNYSIPAAVHAQYRVKNQYVYSSIDEAAKDFILAYNGMSVYQNREYGSTINKIGENQYVFRHICWGAVRTGTTGDCGDHWCFWGDTVAYVHTHGKNMVNANKYFSMEDMNLVNKNDSPYQYAYLGNASGEIYKYKKGDACYDYTKTGKVSGTKLAEKITPVQYIDQTIRQIQNSGDGIYEFTN